MRRVTSGSGSASCCVSGGGGGGSSGGMVPGGRGRSVDCAADAKATAERRTARRMRMASLEGCEVYQLERQLRLAFRRGRLESARLVMIEDRVHDRLRIVDH